MWLGILILRCTVTHQTELTELRSALRDSGHAWGLFELNQAVHLALHNGNCYRLWIAGADVFAPARIAEVDLTEMADTFDRIKQQNL